MIGTVTWQEWLQRDDGASSGPPEAVSGDETQADAT
jgi:hypothetical protein